MCRSANIQQDMYQLMKKKIWDLVLKMFPARAQGCQDREYFESDISQQ